MFWSPMRLQHRTKVGIAVLLSLGLWFLSRLRYRWRRGRQAVGCSADAQPAAASSSASTAPSGGTKSSAGAVAPPANANVTATRGAAAVGAPAAWVTTPEKGTDGTDNDRASPLKGSSPEPGGSGRDRRRSSRRLDAASPKEVAVGEEDENELRKAAQHYNEEYKARIAKMLMPSEEEHARPFIGFSLSEDIRENTLVVDGMFEDGPAFQVGVRIDDELLEIAREPVTTIHEARHLVAKHCRPGRVTHFTLRRGPLYGSLSLSASQSANADDGAGTAASAAPDGTYVVAVWVMTNESRFRGKPYFFDTNEHQKSESARPKRTIE